MRVWVVFVPETAPDDDDLKFRETLFESVVDWFTISIRCWSHCSWRNSQATSEYTVRSKEPIVPGFKVEGTRKSVC